MHTETSRAAIDQLRANTGAKSPKARAWADMKPAARAFLLAGAALPSALAVAPWQEMNQEQQQKILAAARRLRAMLDRVLGVAL